MDFMLSKMKSDTHLLYHTHKDGVNKIPAYLDDLSYLADALLQLNIASADAAYLYRAKEILDFVSTHFNMETGSLFSFTNKHFMQVSIQKTETYDGALPSSNSVLCKSFYHAGLLFGDLSRMQLSERMLDEMRNFFTSYPGSFGVWAGIYLNRSSSSAEVTVAGPEALKNIRQIYNKFFLSHVTYTVVNTNEENIAELRGKYAEGETRIYICKNQTCLEPFTSIDEAMTVIY
jgi:hypothetical protein